MGDPKSKLRRQFSAQETGVRGRLREVRERLNLSQNEAARQLDIKRARLMSYEDGRAPITFEFGLAFCRQFVVSEEWLALGEKEILTRKRQTPLGKKFKLGTFWHPSNARMCMSLLAEPICREIKRKTIFIDAYSLHLDSVYQELCALRFYPRVLFSESASNDLLKNYFHALMEIWLGRLDTVPEKFRFLNSLAGIAEGFANDISEGRLTDVELNGLIEEARLTGALSEDGDVENPHFREFIREETPKYLARLISGVGIPSAKKQKMELTDVAMNSNFQDVKAKLPALRKRLNVATHARGTKTALAKFMGVSLSKVSHWLAGSHEPGGEHTLKLLHWVEHEERQK